MAATGDYVDSAHTSLGQSAAHRARGARRGDAVWKWSLPVLLAGGLAVAAGCGGQNAATSAGPSVRSACDIALPSPRPSLAPAFAVPQDGRIVVRRLVAGALVCRLLRVDGSRFAEAFRDRHRQILSLAFFRRNGAPLTAVAAAY